MTEGKKVVYRVIYGDTDCGGVVYYGNYFRFFEIGRTELLRTTGLSYRQIEEEEGLILPVVEAHARYRAPARYDDELLIETRVSELQPHKIRFDYVIYREGRPIVQGYTVHAPINREGRLVKFPARILQCLQGLVRSPDREKNNE
ncbi:MAG: acyl-CoA thioesterase [Thermodesulfobacteria bacterium]|nr:acyl-CoA thioesterase [Thermodesulfobacteriota bacterium]